MVAKKLTPSHNALNQINSKMPPNGFKIGPVRSLKSVRGEFSKLFLVVMHN